MKHFEIKRLIMVALVAGLPIACGTSLPTGPDGADVDAGANVTALRTEPGLPPTAPEAPSPETVPVPDKVDPADDSVVPAVDPNTGRRPGPRPSDGPPSTDPLPEGGNVPAIPTPQPDGDAGSIPMPTGARPVPAPTAPATNVPAPPWPDGAEGARQCVAGMAEILILRGSLPLPLHEDSVLLEMVMLGKDAKPVPDGSCQGVAWSFLGEGTLVSGATIKVGADTRFASVSGVAGEYMIRATAPNGTSATVAIRLQ